MDPVRVDQGELFEGLFPVGDDLAFDEPAGGFALVGPEAAFRSRSRARRSSMLQIASQSSLTTAGSLGNWPRFRVTLRSW